MAESSLLDALLATYWTTSLCAAVATWFLFENVFVIQWCMKWGLLCGILVDLDDTHCIFETSAFCSLCVIWKHGMCFFLSLHSPERRMRFIKTGSWNSSCQKRRVAGEAAMKQKCNWGGDWKGFCGVCVANTTSVQCISIANPPLPQTNPTQCANSKPKTRRCHFQKSVTICAYFKLEVLQE